MRFFRDKLITILSTELLESEIKLADACVRAASRGIYSSAKRFERMADCNDYIDYKEKLVQEANRRMAMK